MKIAVVIFALPWLCIACSKNKNGNKLPKPSLEDYNKGLAFVDSLNDSAYFYFTKAISSSNYDPYIALSYNRMAVLEFDAGDYFRSEESAVESLKYLDKKDSTIHYLISSNYTAIGNNKLNQKLYDEAITYFDSAIKFDNSNQYKSINVNNKALAFQKKGNLRRAVELYNSILEESKSYPKENARIRSNLALTRWQDDQDYNPIPELFAALAIQKAIGYHWGMNASFAHLSDYYAQKNIDSALYYARKMYEVASDLRSVDDQLEALEKIIRFAPLKYTKPYYARFKQMDDSLENVRNTARNKYALLRYNTEKSKAENLMLQQDNERKQVRITYHRILFWSTILLAMLIILLLVNFFRKRRKKLEWQARERIRENQLRTSRKVHDVVANGLYRIMNELEHQEGIDKEKLLDKIETLYEHSRDIAHDKPLAGSETFSKNINHLLQSFASGETRILIVGNQEEFWQNNSARIKTELEQVLQELMVNMKKHSRAQNVVLKFVRSSNALEIQYKDDGIGLPEKVLYGKGIRNTENRIASLNGSIKFDGTRGLEVNLKIPTAD